MDWEEKARNVLNLFSDIDNRAKQTAVAPIATPMGQMRGANQAIDRYYGTASERAQFLKQESLLSAFAKLGSTYIAAGPISAWDTIGRLGGGTNYQPMVMGTEYQRAEGTGVYKSPIGNIEMLDPEAVMTDSTLATFGLISGQTISAGRPYISSSRNVLQASTMAADEFYGSAGTRQPPTQQNAPAGSGASLRGRQASAEGFRGQQYETLPPIDYTIHSSGGAGKGFGKDKTPGMHPIMFMNTGDALKAIRQGGAPEVASLVADGTLVKPVVLEAILNTVRSEAKRGDKYPITSILGRITENYDKFLKNKTSPSPFSLDAPEPRKVTADKYLARIKFLTELQRLYEPDAPPPSPWIDPTILSMGGSGQRRRSSPGTYGYPIEGNQGFWDDRLSIDHNKMVQLARNGATNEFIGNEFNMTAKDVGKLLSNIRMNLGIEIPKAYGGPSPNKGQKNIRPGKPDTPEIIEGKLNQAIKDGNIEKAKRLIKRLDERKRTFSSGGVDEDTGVDSVAGMIITGEDTPIPMAANQNKPLPFKTRSVESDIENISNDDLKLLYDENVKRIKKALESVPMDDAIRQELDTSLTQSIDEVFKDWTPDKQFSQSDAFTPAERAAAAKFANESIGERNLTRIQTEDELLAKQLSRNFSNDELGIIWEQARNRMERAEAAGSDGIQAIDDWITQIKRRPLGAVNAPLQIRYLEWIKDRYKATSTPKKDTTFDKELFIDDGDPNLQTPLKPEPTFGSKQELFDWIKSHKYDVEWTPEGAIKISDKDGSIIVNTWQEARDWMGY